MTGLEAGGSLHEQVRDAAANFRQALGIAPPDDFIETRAHFPKFVFHLSTHRSRTSESHGPEQTDNSGAVFPFEVPEQNLPLVVQELQMGGTGNERRGDGHETLLARAGRPAI
jgi:hypothetical protein